MAGDLGVRAGQVHEVLRFWFGLTKEQHFAKDGDLDREVAARFSDLVAAIVADDAAGCWEEPDPLLGAIIAVDQFSRNIHRGSAAAFAGDRLAQRLTLHGIAKGWEERYEPTRRIFFYMPLMHAEDRSVQALSVDKFEELGIGENLAFAKAHRDAIERFGRFPGRNVVLGRETTPEERRWLEENDGGW